MSQYYLSFYLDLDFNIRYTIDNICASTPSDAIRKIPFSPLYNVFIKDIITGNIIIYNKVVNIADKKGN